ncbi:MAG: hypothetical protein PVS3B1_20630 [Ktedonobacteraceae bacterium]
MSLARVRDVSKRGTAADRVPWPGIWQKGTTLCSLLINASVYIIIARSLGPQIFGSYLFVQWLATITVPVIGTGMSALASRQIAEIQSREPPRLIAGVFYFLWYRQHRSILLYCLTYVFLSFFLAHIFHQFTSGLLLLTGLSTLPLLLSSVAGTALRSIRRVDLLTMLHLFYVLLSLFFVIIATQINGEPMEAFILALALASTLTLILAVVCVIRLLPLGQAIQPGIFLRERLTGSLHHSWVLFLLDAIVWQRCELLLLACWHNAAEVGFYIVSSVISAKVIKLAPTLFSQWLFPLVLRYMPGYRYLKPYTAFVETSCYMIFLAVPICALLIAFSPALILHSLGSAYLPVVQPLRLLLLASAFGSVATVSLTHLEGNKDLQTLHTREIRHTRDIQLWLNAGVVGLKVCLVLPFILLWGINGAALASAIAQIASALVSIFLCKRLLKHAEASSSRDLL